MKIIIEDGLSLKIKRGIGQYTERLYEILSKDYDVVMKRKTLLENIKNSTLRRILYTLWLNTVFVIKLLFAPSGTVCFFTATATPFIKIKKVKYHSVMHDIRAKVHPELSTDIQNHHANFINWTAINFADKLITVSEQIKKEIIEFYKIDNNKLHILYNVSSIQNIMYDEKENILHEHNIKSKNYLFFIGGLDKNKNVSCILQAFDIISKKYPELQLVIGGNNGNDNSLKTNNKNIIFTGFISDEDVKVLYKNALMYLFPSLYEGFGIPILDAQFMDCPVICSDIPIFHEAGADSVIYAKPNAEDFAKQIDYLLKNEDIRTKIVENGKKNIKRFSREIVFEQIKKMLEDTNN